MSRTRKSHEAPEIGACSSRMMRALVKRSANGEELALEELLKLEALLPQYIADAGRGLRTSGYSLSMLAKVTHTSRQACSKRFSLESE